MKRPLLHTGPLAAMAEEILAHADCMMRTPPPVNRIQQALAMKMAGRAHIEKWPATWRADYELAPP